MSPPIQPKSSAQGTGRFLRRLIGIAAFLNVSVFTLAVLTLHQTRVRYDERATAAANNIAIL